MAVKNVQVFSYVYDVYFSDFRHDIIYFCPSHRGNFRVPNSAGDKAMNAFGFCAILLDANFVPGEKCCIMTLFDVETLYDVFL